MSIKFPAGLTLVVHALPEAFTENNARYRASGKVFVPPWRVWAYGPAKKLPRGAMQTWAFNDVPGMAVAVYGVFTFEATNLVPRHTLDTFPHAWAPRPLQGVSAWLETNDGLTAYETTTEEVKTDG